MINLPPEARQSPFGVEQGHVIQQLGCFADAEASRFEHIMSNGIRLNYEEFGSGPTLLLLNGPMQNLCLTEDMRQHLHHNFRCIVVDLPGFGGTIVPDDYDFSLQSDSTLIEDLFICLDIHDFAVLDQGYGACLAATAARRTQKSVHAASTNSSLVIFQGEEES